MAQIASPPFQPPHLTIKPASGFSGLELKEVWRFRDLLGGLARRDVRLRYRQAALGVVWVVLQPLMAAGALNLAVAIISGGVKSVQGVPLFVFLFISMLGWNAFSSTLTKASSCLVGNANLVSKVYFPRLILPLSIVPSTLLDFAVGLVVLAGLMTYCQIVPTLALLTLPFWLLMLLIFAVGFGLYAAALMVTYRDVQYILPLITQLLLYISAVINPVSDVPEAYRTYYMLNPIVSLMEGFRWSVMGTGQLQTGWLIYSIVFAIVVFFFGAIAFKRMERRFADVI